MPFSRLELLEFSEIDLVLDPIFAALRHALLSERDPDLLAAGGMGGLVKLDRHGHFLRRGFFVRWPAEGSRVFGYRARHDARKRTFRSSPRKRGPSDD
jgi:hypothetical protein